jgi:putative ABC transport system ATP-binding protein
MKSIESTATGSNNAHSPLSSSGALIRLQGLTRTYSGPAGPAPVLRGIDLAVNRGEYVAIIGKSGSGKSTLLNIISGIDLPTSGEVNIGGVIISALDQDRLTAWRGRNVGVIFQFFQLLPSLTVLENVMLPMECCRTYPVRQRRERALMLLEQVGVVEQAGKFPAALSGGEQQRVAIARAQANDPPIIVADEPTGNLDSQNAASIFKLFAGLVNGGKTLLVVTHARDISQYATRILTLADGRIVPGNSLVL